MTVTLGDVALRAGVSRSAVSRTFTKGASVSEKTRQKVEQAAAELGYHRNELASSLTTGRTKLIGLISNNFQNPVFLEVFDLFTRGLQSRGLRPLIVNLSDDDDHDNALAMMRQYSVDGVVISSTTLPPSFAERFSDANIPVIHCFGRAASIPKAHVIGIDNVEAGRLAAQTLLARGYKSIGFLGGPEAATSTQDRLSGFLSITDQDSDCAVALSFAPAYAFDAGYNTMRQQLDATPCDAYFCGDDILSVGALAAIKEAGLKTPDDIGILGLNDIDIASWVGVELTTIHQPIDAMISASIELMETLMEQPDLPAQIHHFPCHVTERKTLRAPLDINET